MTDENEPAPARAQDDAPFAVGSGRMARLVRAFDWGATALGPPADWPSELKTAVGFILESRFPKAIVWGRGLVTIYNDAFRPILGDKPEALGRSFAEVWAEAWDEIGPIAERAFAGEATYIEDFPLVIERFGRPEQAWFTFCYSPLRLADGAVAGMMDTVIETTAAVRARSELDVLNRELGHRLKNTLAMVQAIASQTLRGVSEREAVGAFEGRIVAMARAHNVLLEHSWSGASLRQVAEAALAPLNGMRQIAVAGPEVAIGPRATLTLTLLIHELATNAAKYGALSAPTGRVALSWTFDDERLRLSWRETGGPQVRPPSREGFGSRLMESGLAGDAVVLRRYPAAGFEADVELPAQTLLDG